MLQRAASNAYSWWWASHIRTKQSKWLDTDLEEMDERVKSMIKIIDEEGDSFAKKAEMYFKKRPELLESVEETYKAYRALAEKYDHISSELHKANHTIATAFPDQIEYNMQDDDDSLNLPKAISSGKLHKPLAGVPRIGITIKRKEADQSALKKSRLVRVASQNSKDKVQDEIDKLQKGILVLQTEKEFIRSSYESRVAKYSEIETQITEMQEEVFSLQDEFSSNVVIEDDDARTLMVATALRSCESSLVKLQEQQQRAMEETKEELERIKIAKEKIESAKSQEVIHEEESSDSESVCEHIEITSDISVEELAEKINELVSKVISFELAASSQTAQMKRMSVEIDVLQRNLQSSEEEKRALILDAKSLRDRLQQAEEELQRRQELEESVVDKEVVAVQNEKATRDSGNKEDGPSLTEHTEDEDGSIQTRVAKQEIEISSLQAVDNVDLSNESKLQLEKNLDQSEVGSQDKDDLRKSQETKQEVEINSQGSIHPSKRFNPHLEKSINQLEVSTSQIPEIIHPSEESKLQIEENVKDEPIKSQVAQQEDEINGNIQPHNESNLQFEEDPDTSLNSLQALVNKLEGKEKTILTEYASTLRNYKDTKKMLSEAEKQNQEHHKEMTQQIRELKSSNAMKDAEIHSLRKNLRSLQLKSSENARISDPLIFEREDKTAASFEDNDIDVPSSDVPHTISVIEEKFRRDIDTILEENLEFWLRFSSSSQNRQLFQTTFEDLQAEIDKLKSRKSGGEGSNQPAAGKSANLESLLIDKKLKELKTEIQVWLEQNMLLQGELENKFLSLGSIQEEISTTLEASLEGNIEEEGVLFAPYQAAKFHGELLNMQLENNKVEEELKAGIDDASELQAEVEKTLLRLHGKSGLPESPQSASSSHRDPLRHSSTKNQVPLRSFLFTQKPKKRSMFSKVNPALQKRMGAGRGRPS